MKYSNWRCNLNRKVRLIKKMFGFGPRLKLNVGPRDDEDLKKRAFLKWQLGVMAGVDSSKVTGLEYAGNNTWRFNPAFGCVKEFVVLKDMTQRHQPHIQYGKVNDQWVKLKHKGYYILENQET
jgi:hypothetical protein